MHSMAKLRKEKFSGTQADDLSQTVVAKTHIEHAFYGKHHHTPMIHTAQKLKKTMRLTPHEL